MRIDMARFEELVAEALDDLPEWIGEQVRNVAVLVQVMPTPAQRKSSRLGRNQTLLGLYEGVPLTKRGRRYGMLPPDRITLFMIPMAANADDELELVALIRRTVVHEIAHHFGFSEDQIRELGY